MKKETLTSYCTNKIRNLILEGKLLPGERIKGDYLKSYLGVGLSPIREALSRLVSTSLIESVDNVGFKVASITKSRVIDFYKSYAKIEALLFKEAIECGNESWESNIVAALYQLAKIENIGTKANYKAWSIQNENFHEALINGCPLVELKKVRASFTLLKEWYHNLAYGQSKNELVSVNHSEHSKIVELAIARKVESASAMLYHHTMHSLDSLVLRLEQVGYITN